MNQQGRIVIPAPIREALGFKTDDDLILTVENGSLLIQRSDNSGRSPAVAARRSAN
jgi:AbrB family looped-hinge helix DNA binding protein